MSQEHPERESYQGCNSYDSIKPKQLDSNPIIRKLQDKIELLNFRLTECKNENHVLMRNLQLARKMMHQEVGGDEINFLSLMNKSKESGSRIRKENISVLKSKVQELKDYLKQMERDENPTKPHEKHSELVFRTHSSRKKLWRTELEYRLARESAEKDIRPLVQECFELRRDIDIEKNRFKELNEEIDLIRAEQKSQMIKSRHEVKIMHLSKTLEDQLKKTLKEREDLFQSLEGSRVGNKRIADQIISLKDELQILQKKSSDSQTLINAMTRCHKNVHGAIDTEKIITLQNIDRFKEDLKILQENCRADSEMLDYLQRIIYDRNTLIDEINHDINAMSQGSEERKKNDKRTKLDDRRKTSIERFITLYTRALMSKGTGFALQSEEDQNTNQKNIASRIRSLYLELMKYKVLCDAVKMEREHLNCITSRQEGMMNEAAAQVLDTGQLIKQTVSEKKELIEKVSKLHRSILIRRRRGKFHVQPRNRFEELRIKIDIQREENDFLRNFLHSILCEKDKDLQLFKDFIADIKRFFQASLSEIQQSLTANQFPQMLLDVQIPFNE